MKYRADIDGLRFVAVAPVVLFHAGLPGFSGGFIGVDVFFVISGYLITGILKGEAETGRFSILRFYERRARRILPALVATMAATTALALLVFLPSYLADFAKSLVATAAFVSNLYFWKYSGYFENAALLRPLLHTWSLAVEEQFYIFMPLAVYAVNRLLPRRWGLVFGAVAAASFALSVYLTSVGPTANFFLLPSRTWELLLGGLLAMRPPPRLRSQRALDALSVLACALILAPVFLYSEATPFPGLAALPPCLGAALLIYCGTGGASLAGRILAAGPLVFVGKISYSLYLVHWPVAVFTRYLTLQAPGPATAALIVGASLVLAVLSWRFIERPFRSAEGGVPRRAIFVLSGASLSALAAVGAVLVALHGLPARFPGFQPTVVAGGSGWREGTCFFEPGEDLGRWSARACDLNPRSPSAERALLWGDSFAAHYAPGIIADGPRIPFHILQYTFAGCPPVIGYYSYARPSCTAFNNRALEIIDREHVRTVVLSARWVDLRQRGLSSLQATIAALRRRGVTTYVIGQSPIFAADVDVIGFMKGDRRRPLDAWPSTVTDAFNAALRRAAAGARFIDPIAAWCAAGRCPYRAGPEVLFGDTGHFTRFGARRAVEAYFPLVRRGEVVEAGGGRTPPAG